MAKKKALVYFIEVGHISKSPTKGIYIRDINSHSVIICLTFQKENVYYNGKVRFKAENYFCNNGRF